MDHFKLFAFFTCILLCFGIGACLNLVNLARSVEPRLRPIRTTAGQLIHSVVQGKSMAVLGGESFADEVKKLRSEASTMDAADEELYKIAGVCNKTFPTATENLMELNETGEYPAGVGRDAKCYLNCIFTHLKLFDDKGNISPPFGMWMTDTDEDKVKMSAFKKCFVSSKATSQDECEQSYDRVSCLIKTVMNADNERANTTMSTTTATITAKHGKM